MTMTSFVDNWTSLIWLQGFIACNESPVDDRVEGLHLFIHVWPIYIEELTESEAFWCLFDEAPFGRLIYMSWSHKIHRLWSSSWSDSQTSFSAHVYRTLFSFSLYCACLVHFFLLFLLLHDCRWFIASLSSCPTISSYISSCF